MPNKTLILLTFSLLCLALLPIQAVATAPPQTSDEIPRISVAQLLLLIETEPVVIIDARIPRAWNRAGNKIPDAIRLDSPEQITRFTDTVAREQAIVLYCL